MDNTLYTKLREIQDKDEDAAQSIPFNNNGRRPYYTCRVYDGNGDPRDTPDFIECIGFRVLDNAVEAAKTYLSYDEDGDIVDIFEEEEDKDGGIYCEPEQVWSSTWK